MCGIYTYVGQKAAEKEVLAGLKRLLYRGYDSWGVAGLVDKRIQSVKEIGVLRQTKPLGFGLSHMALGHTRWATHGGVTQKNAHPHLSQDGSLALAHNGIVENFAVLKNDLIQQGETFVSETDSEVILRLIERALKNQHHWPTIFKQVYDEIRGRNTIVVLTRQGEIWAVRDGSPLVIGVGQNEIILSSDTMSLPSRIKKMIFVDNHQVVGVNAQGKLSIYSLDNDQKIKPKFEVLHRAKNVINKDGYQHYMLKEIYQSAKVVKQVRQMINQPQLDQAAKLVSHAQKVYVIGSGSAGVAAGQIAYYLRTIAQVDAVSLIGADASSYLNLFDSTTVIIAPSQSGETADVIEVLEQARAKGAQIITYVNMPGSMMTRLADVSLMAQAGPEICVMSTKVVLSQMAFGYLLASQIAQQSTKADRQLQLLATSLDKLLKQKKWLRQLKTMAHQLAYQNHIYLLGKGRSYSIIKEGMIKMIEGVYLHAHALPAGDLKHYVIAIVTQGTPVLALVSDLSMLRDVQSALSEVKARGAKTYGLSFTDELKADEHLRLPHLTQLTELLGLVALQLLSYYMALELGNNIDKPRNIAKSVTVK